MNLVLCGAFAVLGVVLVAVGFTGAAVACAIGALFTGLWYASAKRTHFTWSDGQLTFSSLTKTMVVADGDTAGRVVHVVVSKTGTPNPDVQLWIGADGKAKASLIEAGWDLHELEQLRDLAGLSSEHEPAPVTMRQLNDRYPGAVPEWAARPRTTAAVICGLVVFAAAVIGIVFAK